ncbi:hypothetical protein ABT381_00265 [Streptomyces sp. NPDC000151]|uniref:hypothetical protein n=1 Tax=Streptomyces sp. NPDC000151 TaxID=3154244 RepID=UPI00332AB9D4
MRTRLALTGAALGATLLTGASVATAQAAPVSSDTSTTTAVASGAYSWIYVGTYRTHAECYADGRNSAYSQWDCKPVNGKYQLWVNDAS